MMTATNPSESGHIPARNDVPRAPILVVDDVQDNRELLEEMLLSAGYEQILQASSGLEALNILESRTDVGLVLLDLMMPGMDGYEVCQRISGSEKTAHIPVIVVTGAALRRDEALIKSYERGAMDFIPKPVNEVEFYGRVRSALQLYCERIRTREKTQALQESQQRYELAVSGVSDGIWDMNLVTQKIYHSAQWKKILGYEDHELPSTMGMLEVWEKNVHPDDKEEVLAAIQDHWNKKTSHYSTEHRLKTKSGSYKWVFSRGRAIWDRNGTVVRMAGSTTDITERKNLESQLRQAQQLESIGRLAAGIAHDFNNLLTAIVGHAELMQLRLDANSSLQLNVDTIQKASMQAAELCKQMLAYAGQGSFSVERVDINSLISDTLRLLRISVSKKIALDLALSPEPMMIKADISQIRQVIMNLVINAAEAIGDDTGTIRIVTSAIYPAGADLADAVLAPKLSAGQHAQIEVTDTGCGMSKETLQKIFEPFFTTKMTGRGLGLSAVLGIVKAHHGSLRITSQIAHGTSFKILIPLTEEPPPASDANNAPEGALWRGSGTILLVDDEPGVRECTGSLLTELGFDVLLAEDGEQGVEVFKAREKDIVAVVLDLTMPRLNGAEVFERIRTISPQTPVLLSSGYAEEEAIRRFAGKGLAGFLQKPFMFSKLTAQLKQCLNPPC